MSDNEERAEVARVKAWESIALRQIEDLEVRLARAEAERDEALTHLRKVLPAAEAELVTLPYIGNSQLHEQVRAARAWLLSRLQPAAGPPEATA